MNGDALENGYQHYAQEVARHIRAQMTVFWFNKWSPGLEKRLLGFDGTILLDQL